TRAACAVTSDPPESPGNRAMSAFKANLPSHLEKFTQAQGSAKTLLYTPTTSSNLSSMEISFTNTCRGSLHGLSVIRRGAELLKQQAAPARPGIADPDSCVSQSSEAGRTLQSLWLTCTLRLHSRGRVVGSPRSGENLSSDTIRRSLD